ncbi:MAG: VCBS repeat-containing protein [Saprospiraceae bacterium]
MYIGDHLDLYALNRQGAIQSSWRLQTPAVDVKEVNRTLFVLGIGSFSPSDKQEGVFFPLKSDVPSQVRHMVIEHLPRPVQFDFGDLNGDGVTDLVVCGFGNHQGKLAWYDQGLAAREHVLTTLPGARKAIIQDINGDGKPDIMTLMAQAWEKLTIYLNQGEGKFKEETAIGFPPVYGVSYFELDDFNGDGHPDVLLTNGDNWDYSPVDKPYHGIRIFLNDGSNHFSETYFFPMYGCSEARAVDFDRDGDLDLVGIAFYNNLSTVTAQSFVYLENTGDLHFVAHYMPETACGRWLTMDVGDYNGDGYTDVFLGSYFHNLAELTKSLQTGISEFPQVLMLTFQP